MRILKPDDVLACVNESPIDEDYDVLQISFCGLFSCFFFLPFSKLNVEIFDVTKWQVEGYLLYEVDNHVRCHWISLNDEALFVRSFIWLLLFLISKKESRKFIFFIFLEMDVFVAQKTATVFQPIKSIEVSIKYMHKNHLNWLIDYEFHCIDSIIEKLFRVEEEKKNAI